MGGWGSTSPSGPGRPDWATVGPDRAPIALSAAEVGPGARIVGDLLLLGISPELIFFS